MSNCVSKSRSPGVVTFKINRDRLAWVVDNILSQQYPFEMPKCTSCHNARVPRDCVICEGQSRCDLCICLKYVNCNAGGITDSACGFLCSSLLVSRPDIVLLSRSLGVGTIPPGVGEV